MKKQTKRSVSKKDSGGCCSGSGKGCKCDCGDGKGCGCEEGKGCSCAEGGECCCDGEECGADCACHAQSDDQGASYYVRIRPFVPVDFRPLRSIWKLSQVHLDDTDSSAALSRSGRKGYRVLVAEVGPADGSAAQRRVVGGVILTFDSRRAWVHHLAVHPKFRRLGLGRALMEACERQAHAWGARHLRLLVNSEASSQAACRLYESEGWEGPAKVKCYRKTL